MNVWGKCISLLTPLDLKKKSHQQRRLHRLVVHSLRLVYLFMWYNFHYYCILCTLHAESHESRVQPQKKSQFDIPYKRRKNMHMGNERARQWNVCVKIESLFFLSFCTFFWLARFTIQARIPKSLFFHLSFISVYSSENQPREICFKMMRIRKTIIKIILAVCNYFELHAYGQRLWQGMWTLVEN